MAVNAYFQDELAYLRELGDEFARTNPNLAPFLSRQSNDPDVERLLEGFAFLTARLRQKLDDDLPELSHSLLTLLWPHYLRPVPATAIIQFEPVPRSLTRSQRLPRGIMLDAKPVEGTRCTFKTVYDVDLNPLTITTAGVESGVGTSQLSLQCQLGAGAGFGGVRFDRLRIHLDAARDTPLARALYLLLCRHVRSAAVRSAGGQITELPGVRMTPVGFAEDEGVIPYPANGLVPYRVLQEYFVCPTKFMFLDVEGLEPIAALEGTNCTLMFRFDRPFEEAARVTHRNFVLNCTPAVNLFPHDAVPIRVDQAKTEYRLRPDGADASHYDIYSVDQVSGWIQGQRERVDYQPFESFRHAVEGGDRAYYRLRMRPSVVGEGADLYVSFVNGRDATIIPPTETVSLSLTCTNGRLAELIGAGNIDQATTSSPSQVTFRNLAPVTPQLPPPLSGNVLWRLLSNLALGTGTLANLDALRSVLATYDFRALTDAQARQRLDLLLQSLLAVRSEPIDILRHGLPVRGARFVLDIDDRKIGGIGEMFLLASVLERYLALCASVNSCNQLTARGTASNLVYSWPPRGGLRAPL
ncbi:MAG TPA: type VI secretion system baseplate subunit TssF [Stellaceae bacterium]|nr:type VI secretion system baseplate subunit TssF [Stellaceae bacterium]